MDINSAKVVSIKKPKMLIKDDTISSDDSNSCDNRSTITVVHHPVYNTETFYLDDVRIDESLVHDFRDVLNMMIKHRVSLKAFHEVLADANWCKAHPDDDEEGCCLPKSLKDLKTSPLD